VKVQSQEPALCSNLEDAKARRSPGRLSQSGAEIRSQGRWEVCAPPPPPVSAGGNKRRQSKEKKLEREIKRKGENMGGGGCEGKGDAGDIYKDWCRN
jgi:hypothetical protein